MSFKSVKVSFTVAHVSLAGDVIREHYFDAFDASLRVAKLREAGFRHVKCFDGIEATRYTDEQLVHRM